MSMPTASYHRPSRAWNLRLVREVEQLIAVAICLSLARLPEELRGEDDTHQVGQLGIDGKVRSDLVANSLGQYDLAVMRCGLGHQSAQGFADRTGDQDARRVGSLETRPAGHLAEDLFRIEEPSGHVGHTPQSGSEARVRP